MRIRYNARNAGPVDEVFACRVFGMACPLGFAFKGKNRVSFVFERDRNNESFWLFSRNTGTFFLLYLPMVSVTASVWSIAVLGVRDGVSTGVRS